MGSQSKRHGITGIKHRRPKSNVNVRVRKTQAGVRKKALLTEIATALKTAEVE